MRWARAFLSTLGIVILIEVRLFSIAKLLTKEVALVPGGTLFFHRYAVANTHAGTCKPQCCLPFDRLRKIIRRMMVVNVKKFLLNGAPVHGRI